jgi:hypothetical protein
VHLNARLIRSEHRDGYRTGHADDTAARAPCDTWRQQRHGVRGCAWLRGKRGARLGVRNRPQVELVTSRRAQSMRRRPSDAPRSHTPSRRATGPPASPAPTTDVALSPFPHSATPSFAPPPCAGPCPDPALVSLTSARPCAGAVRHTTERTPRRVCPYYYGRCARSLQRRPRSLSYLQPVRREDATCECLTSPSPTWLSLSVARWRP